MIARCLGTALAMALAWSAPAAAQFVDDQKLDRTRVASAGLFAGREGISASTAPFVEQDGAQAVRKGIVGNWQVADKVEVGVGLFSVSRYSRSEPHHARLRPMEDVGRRSQRIAAVGMSFRF